MFYVLYILQKNFFNFFKKLIKQLKYNGFWTLSKPFSASIENIIWDLFFNLLMWCVTLIYLHISKKSMHPGDKSHLITVYDPFNVFLYVVCQYFVDGFCVYVHQQYWPIIFFLRGYLSGFDNRVMAALHRISLGMFLSVQFFGRISDG